MFDRRAVLVALVALPCTALAQKTEPIYSRIIGIGSFEFPIPGTYTYSKDGGNTVLTTVDGGRIYTAGLMRGPLPSDPVAQIAKVESLIRGSWERFAKDEKGAVVREFKSRGTRSGLTVFSMATEFHEAGALQHYVQFAATDGLDIAVLSVEGGGPAVPVIAELEPLVAQVKVSR